MFLFFSQKPHYYETFKQLAYSGRQLTPSQASQVQTAPPNVEKPQLHAQPSSASSRSTEHYSLSNKSSNADDDLEVSCHSDLVSYIILMYDDCLHFNIMKS